MATVSALLVERLPQQADQHVLLLEAGEDLADGVDRLEGRRHAGRPADEDLVGLAVVGSHRAWRAAATRASVAASPVVGMGRSSASGRPTTWADRWAPAAAIRSSPVPSGSSMWAFSTPPLARTATTTATRLPRARGGRPAPRRPRAAGRPPGRRRSSGSTAAWRCPESMRSSSPWARAKKSWTWARSPSPQGARLGADVVDEEAVALVGGDAAGAGVGVGQEALPLELGHLVADRRRRHLQVAHAGDVGRAHRLGRVDVLLDHRPQDGGLAFVQHREGRSYRRVPA